MRSSRVTLSTFLHAEVVFFIDRPGSLLWRVSEKEYSRNSRKLQALTWGLGTNTLSSLFLVDLSKVYLKFL